MKEKTSIKAHKIHLIISPDNMSAYIELTETPLSENKKEREGYEIIPLNEEDLKTALNDYKINFGIDQVEILSLAQAPQLNTKIKIARGIPPIDGKDGFIEFFVKRDKDYKPEISDDDVIDYKNIEFFQMVSKDQILCEITKETQGEEGTNIFGNPVPAKPGRPPSSPKGKNTVFDKDEKFLRAEKDGLVRFVRDTIDVIDVLHIKENVDLSTGNIRFSGDIVINGDVSPGFTVESGGNIKIRGMAEGAIIKAKGDLHIALGINGTREEGIYVGGNLKCGYIESANVKVDGNIVSDYIIGSNIACMGDIKLKGSRELIIGGTIQVHGNLEAKCIGSDREIPTKVVILGTTIRDDKAIEKLMVEAKEHGNKAMNLKQILDKYDPIQIHENEQLSTLRNQFVSLRDYIIKANQKIKKLEDESRVEYDGSIQCKFKIYRGVKIFFGDNLFQRPDSDLGRCRIFIANGEVIVGTL